MIQNMHRKTVYIYHQPTLSFWRLFVIAAIIGISSYHLTGSGSISTLLVLLLLIAGSVKLVLIFLRVSSRLIKIVLIGLIAVAWLGAMLNSSLT